MNDRVRWQAILDEAREIGWWDMAGPKVPGERNGGLLFRIEKVEGRNRPVTRSQARYRSVQEASDKPPHTAAASGKAAGSGGGTSNRSGRRHHPGAARAGSAGRRPAAKSRTSPASGVSAGGSVRASNTPGS